MFQHARRPLRVTSPVPPPSGRKALSRELADFLLDLSIALHKHAMYPDGHPSLAPAAGAVAQRAELLLSDRPTLALGVARHQLVIEGIATDPKHPVLRELADRLHRHHLGAVTFSRGVTADEVRDVLRALAVEADRTGEPLGLGPPDALRHWPHVRLHTLSYDRLELVDEPAAAGEAGSAGVRAAQLWVGLARAALATEHPDQAPPSTEPAVIAKAIDERPAQGTAAYDQAIVGYLLQIAAELKAAGNSEAVALRSRMSGLVRRMKPETLRRLVEMGGDFAQRQRFAADATDGMSLDAVLAIVQAAAETSQQTISHSLVRLLSKFAAHGAAGSAEVRPRADAALREQVHLLLDGWSLADPNPGAYGAALQKIARAAPRVPGATQAVHPPEPDRLVAMGLELDVASPPVLEAADRVVAEGGALRLIEALDALPGQAAATALWRRIATPEFVRALAAAEPVDYKILDRVVPRVGVRAADPLLDALAAASTRGVRRGLLAQLVTLGPGIGPLVVKRLDDERWYVTRNLLGLLEEVGATPPGFSAARFAAHPDARVRWQALKLWFGFPAERDAALSAGLHDADPRVLRLALAVAQQLCPDPLIPLVAALATDRALGSELRLLAIRVLGGSDAPAARAALLQVSAGGRTLLGREKLPPKSPELLATLAALAAGWGKDAAARRVLARAAASRDAEIRAAATGAGAAGAAGAGGLDTRP